MSVELHGGRYLEEEDQEERLDSRLRRFLRGSWVKPRGSKTEGRLDDDTLALQDELKPHGRFVPILLTIVALNAFGTVIWYAYNWSQGSLDDSALPVIASDSDPIKVRPAEEGGLAIPHQDKLVLSGGREEAESQVVEHLLPPPEVPQEEALAAAKEKGAAIDTLGHQLRASKPLPSAPVVTMESVGGTAPAETAATQGPVVRDGTAEQLAAAPDAAPQVPATELPSAAGATQAETPALAPDAAESPAPGPEPTASSAAPVEVQSAQVPTDSGYLLQLAAVQDAAAAEREWARLQQAHPQLLGDLSVTIEKADVGGKTYYRILTGPFPTRATVEDMCVQLKSRKQSCLIKKQAP